MNLRCVSVIFGCIALTGVACKKDLTAEKQRLVESGDRAMAQRKFADAIVDYRRAIAIDSRFGEARLKLAGAYLMERDLRNGLAESVRAADLLPENVPAQLQAGKLLLLAQQFPEAKARAVAALQQQPKNPEALMLMGNAMAGLKEFDDAVSNIEEAIDADPHRTFTYANLGALAAARGDSAAAESAFKRAVEADPKSMTARTALANYYWASDRMDEAERELKTALQIDPKSAVVTRALALLCLTHNRLDEGEAYLKTYADLAGTASARLLLADYYLDVKKIAEARAVLDGLLKTDDGFADAKLRLAAIDFNAGKRAQAYEHLEDVLKRDPKHEQATLQKGRFLLVEQKPSEALAAGNSVVAWNPSSRGGHFLRGLSMEAVGREDDAIKAFQKVLELQPSAAPAQLQLANLFLSRGNAAAAAELAQQAIKNDGRLTAARVTLAKALVRTGDLNRAEAEASFVAKANPSSADVATVLGDIYWTKNDRARARDAYNRAITLQPGWTEAIRGLIRIDLADRNPNAARARVEAELKALPKDVPIMLLAGDVYAATGDEKRAEVLFRSAVQTDPSNIDAYSKLGTLLKSQNRLDEAKKEYEDVLQHQPKVAVPARTMVGIILTLQSKRDEARKQYEQVLALDPQSPVAANNLAWDYAQRGGNLDVALTLAQTAKAHLPKSWEVSDTLGWVYYKKGLHTLAITQFRQGTEQAPANPGMHYHLALAYFKNGDKAQARQSLEQALKLDPKFSDADEARKLLATIRG